MKKFLIFGVITLVALMFGLPAIAKSLANNIELPPLKYGEKSVVFAKDGKHVMGNVAPTDSGKHLNLGQFPDLRLHGQSHMAAEDRRFYKHNGIDQLGITLAMITNAKTRSLSAGGGTITGQYVRGAYLTREKELERKALEWKYSVKIEEVMSKEEILLKYLNTNYYGCGAYGIDDASRAWFGVSATEIKDPKKPLDVARATFLAALIKSPSDYDDPAEGGGLKHEATIANRQRYVLDGLTDLEGVEEIVTPAVIAEAKKLLPLKPKCKVRPSGSSSDLESSLLDYLKDWFEAWQIQIAKDDGFDDKDAVSKGRSTAEAMLARGALQIQLSIDHNLQAQVANAVKSTLPRKDLTAGVIMMNPFTGGVTAMYAGIGQNNALFAQRQPGSIIKAVVAADAVSKGVSLQTVMSAPTYLDGEGPRIWNFNKNPVPDCKMTLADGLAFSHNIVWTGFLARKSGNCPVGDDPQKITQFDYKNAVTPATVAKLLREMGGTLSTKPGQSNPLEIKEEPRLALGDTVHMSPLQVATIGSTLANGGLRTQPYIVERVKTSDGKVLYEHKPQSKRVLEEKHVRVVNQALTGVFTKGTARGAQVPGRQLGGKTGSTPENAWILAFPAANPKDNVPDEVCAGWGGYHQGSVDISDILSSGQMAEICQKVYKTLFDKKPSVNFPQAKDEGKLIGPFAQPPPPASKAPSPQPPATPSAPPKETVVPSPGKS